MSMSQVCRVLQWMCGFVIAIAIAQLLTLLPWSQVTVGIPAVVLYSYGHQTDSKELQITAAGLAFGWAKCFFAG